MTRRVPEWVLSAAAVAGFLAAWEVVARAAWVPPALFPPPSRVASALAEMAESGELAADVRVSLWRAAAGFGLGGAAGVAAGLLTGRLRTADVCLSPLINLFRPLPPVAMIPLMIIWFGIGDPAKVFAIAFAVFFPVWANTHQGARAIPNLLLWGAQTFHVSRWAVWVKVILPGALPYALVGLRIGAAGAYVMVFVSELAGASAGIGYRISVYQLAYRMDAMIAALVVLGALGAATDWALSAGAAAVFPWLPGQRREGTA